MTIPLPLTKLKERYRELFTNISNGISGCFVGTYKSPKSGYIKYILENRELFNDLVPKNTKIVFFEPTYIVSNSPYSWVHQLNLAIQFQDKEYKAIISDDISVVISNIQKYIYDNKQKGLRTAFLINKLDMLWDLDRSSGNIFNVFYNTLKNTPDNACSLTFFLSNFDCFNDSLPSFLKDLVYPIRESIAFFPDLDFEETSYTLKRLAGIYKVKLGKGIEKDIFKYSGGNYSLIFDAVQIASTERKILSVKYLNEDISNHQIITSYIIKFLESFSFQKRLELVNNKESEFFKNLGIVDNKGNIKSEVIRKFVKELGEENIANPSLGVFSENERIVLQYLKERINILVSKEELASVIWEKESESRYSLWAMDKYVSRLRRKISVSNPGLRLVSIRKKGVMLCQ